MKEHKRFMIIDGNALLHRAWHALPPLTTQKGEVVNAVYGFTQILLKALKELSPSYCVVCFDKKGPTFRHKQYEAYKATRIKQPQELYNQIDRIKQVLEGFGIPIFEKEGYEADDLIATLVAHIEKETEDAEPIIVTGDMDTLQLVDNRTKVYTLKKGIAETTIYDEQAVTERYDGLEPSDLHLYKALRGDPSDNIPGVKGIGEKTAIELVKRFGTLEKILAWADDKRGHVDDRLREKVRAYKDDLLMSYELVKLRNDVPIDFDMDDARMSVPQTDELVPLFQELEFRTLIPRLQGVGGKDGAVPIDRHSDKRDGYRLVDTQEKMEEFFKKLDSVEVFAVDTETTSLNVLHAELVGMSFCWVEGAAYFLPWNMVEVGFPKVRSQHVLDADRRADNGGRSDLVSLLKKILENPAVKKIGHNIKYDLHVLQNVGIALHGIEMDTMVGAYVLNPGGRSYGLDALAFQEFGHQMITYEDLAGKGKQQVPITEVPLERLSEYACEDADYTWRLYGRVCEKLEKENLLSVCEKFEVPLIPILAAMERRGVKVDVDFLAGLSGKLHVELEKIEQNIYTLAREKFNINSPIQLKKILFETLGIHAPKLKKGKTGVSTAASELEKMRGLHPIIDEILEYRERSKLVTTYGDALPKLVDEDTGRVHTSFNQTIAATGRLSSSDPNFQNIPIRTEMGREIRKSIVAEKGHILLAADYSQLELRIVASVAKDEHMLAAFREGVDIHAQTAAAVHGVALSEVTPAMRRAAKEVNFGIIYGMGPHGLARAIGISQEEARDFIDRYFAVYPGIVAYMDSTLVEARVVGYVETMFGRRRYIPELSSGVFQVRAAAERAAINMPIQGTGADIIKLAMIAIDGIMGSGTNSSRKLSQTPLSPFLSFSQYPLILQVHDELVFEVPEGSEKECASRIKETMESAASLAAPLVVDVKIGYNWGEMEKL